MGERIVVGDSGGGRQWQWATDPSRREDATGRAFRLLASLLSAVLVCAAASGAPATAAVGLTVRGVDVEVAEATADGIVPVVLRLDRAPRRSVTVSWKTVAGTAEPGQDYEERSGKARFEPGQRRRVVRVPLIDDGVAEGSETFLVRLRSSQARVPDKNVEVVVRDDDDTFGVKLASARADSHVFDDQVSGTDPTLRGATLSSTGPDGTVYTLRVPDGALTADTTVTMTPWRSATGTGVAGGRPFGVRLTPSGTEFLLPVTLLVDPPGRDDLPAVTSTRESGTSHGYPAALGTDQLVLPLTHFSDYFGALGEGTSITIVDPGTLNPQQALADEMERTLREERNRQLRGEDPDPTVMEKVEQLMTAYYDNVVAPRLAGIRSDCTEAEAHTGHVVGFARQAALLGILESQQQAIMEATAAGAENCLQEALEPCVDTDDAGQVRRILGYWRQVELLGGTVPDPRPLDPVRHCKDLLGGMLTVTVDSLLEVNGFRTEEHWTLVYQPRLRKDDSYQAWYDDGRGGWTVSGSYLREDLRPGAQCRVMIDTTYSGAGTLFTTYHGQLDPASDQDKGIAELSQFFPDFDGNLGLTPAFDGEVVGNATRTTYQTTDDGCVSSTEDLGHWFSPSWGTNTAPGAIVETEVGRGAQFDYSFSRDNSDAQKTDTYEVTLAGSLVPTRG